MSLAPRISVVTLGVADLVRATAFYERLGWKKSSMSGPNVTFIQLDSMVLGLFSRASLAEDAGVDNTPPGFSGVTLAQVATSEDEVDRIFDFAVRCGATPIKPPQKAFWGGRSGYFADPDGHLWEVAHDPNFQFDQAGCVRLPV